MPYRICKSFTIECGHLLSGHPDRCRFPHGHSRRVDLVLAADDLDENQMVCDYKVLKEAIGAFIDTFDHAFCINSADPHYTTLRQAFGERLITFDQVDPTTEVLAKRIYDETVRRLREYANRDDTRYALRAKVRLVKVRLWETATSWAEYNVE